MSPENANGYSAFVKNLAQTAFYVAAIAGVAWSAAKWDERSRRVETAIVQLQLDVVTRSEFDRKFRGVQVRAKRLYNKNGWEYEEVE